MDLAATFDDVLHIATSGPSAQAAWRALVEYLESLACTRWPALNDLDVGADIERVRAALQRLLAEEPPPPVAALWFGLFDALDDAARDTIGFYVAGVERFDPTDADTLCAPAWWPEGRYLQSALLHAVKDEELAAEARGDGAVRELLGYAGQLGAALIVARFASAGMLAGVRRVVGFDDGDFAALDA